MGTITAININNLYWLGRYVERVFTTLNSFFKYADRFIEGGQAAYEKYLSDINVPDIYENSDDFFKRYVFDKSDPNSIISNLERALGNGIVLREEIKTPSLSYLQMAMDKFEACERTDKIRYDMLPVRDAIYAFWGSIDSNMTDAEALKIIHIGKEVERADMYLRLGYPEEEISVEVNSLLKLVSEFAEKGCIVNIEAYNSLIWAVKEQISFSKHAGSVINSLENLIEVNFFETVSV